MKLISTNKKAYHDYEVQDTLEAWIVLTWHEVKSIKSGQVNLRDAIIKESWSDMYIYNLDIPLYKHTSRIQVWQYVAKAKRRLLLHKKEIAKLVGKTHKTSLLLIPLQIYLTKTHRIKILLGVCKQHRKYQKKQIFKEKDISRSMDKQIKHLWL